MSYHDDCMKFWLSNMWETGLRKIPNLNLIKTLQIIEGIGYWFSHCEIGQTHTCIKLKILSSKQGLFLFACVTWLYISKFVTIPPNACTFYFTLSLICEFIFSKKECDSWQSLAVHNFYVGEGSDFSGVPTKMLTVNGSLKLSVYNPASIFGIHVSANPVSLIYSEIPVATGQVKLLSM